MSEDSTADLPEEETEPPRIREFVEMILVAGMMALVLRCFLVEVFMIPTGSMEPTLQGASGQERESGDRIMVNKFYYQMHEVERFDVIVFRFPLNVTRNFIKRVVGKGPEYLRKYEGDIYTSPNSEGPFRIARKPLTTQEAIWIPVGELDWTVRIGESNVQNSLPDQPDDEWRVHYPGRIRDSERNPVDDLKLSARVSQLGEGEEMQMHLEEGPYRFTLDVQTESESELRIRNRRSGEVEDKRPVEAGDVLNGEEDRVDLFVYDGQVGVQINGTHLLTHNYRSTLEEHRSYPDGIPPYSDAPAEGLEELPGPGIRGSSGNLRVLDLELSRDLYYWWGEDPSRNFSAEEGPVFVPENRYLTIGDNINDSRDSRKWKQHRVVLENGREHIFDKRDWDRARQRNADFVVDRFGNRVPLPGREEIRETETRPLRFIRESLLVGKPLWVFWPYHRIQRIY